MAISFNSRSCGLYWEHLRLIQIESSLKTLMKDRQPVNVLAVLADDAAGLALISKTRGRLVRKGASDQEDAANGQGMLRAAAAGAAEVSNVLNRMRELAIQATNGTNSIAEREALQDEAELLTAEISRIAKQRHFNGSNPLFGMEMDLHLGTPVEKRITTKIDGVSASDLQLDGGNLSFVSSKNARDAIGVIDQALEKIVSIGGNIVANVGRISNTIDHLSNTKKNSNIKTIQMSDAKGENEHMRLTKSQMLEQASITMLAQGKRIKRDDA